MLIRSILHDKGAFVATIGREATVLDATSALAEHGIGALVVSSDGEMVEGIMSERDVARWVAREGATALERRVYEIMTSDVVTCAPDDTVHEVMAVMTDRRFRHLPVVMGTRMIGIISLGDLVRHRLSELETETRTLHEYISTGR